MTMVQITIIGMGQIGVSIGLALASQKNLVKRVGIDKDAAESRQAQKIGALDQVMFNLPDAVKDAGVVILATPMDELRETLKVIAPALQAGSVVLHTSPVRVAVENWAKELMPAECYFISLTPTLNPAYFEETPGGLETAHADLFHNSLMIISHALGTHADAIKLAADLSTMLGAKPFFADSYEADGLLAASTLLPQLSAAALLNAVIDQPGWDEGRKLAGRAFAQATQPVQEITDKDYPGQAAILNRDNVVRVLDNLIDQLYQIRQMVNKEDTDGLVKLLSMARTNRPIWMKERRVGDWMPAPPPMPTGSDVYGRIIGLRPKKDRK